ncbi:hypothetical protein QUB68_01890 [Microcoleus sp. A006_D1]|uniref:hypothetical protein n=1 Tax=Microcoleus sp. A006_D1 TaxID=3055267 RepID=UPI002FD31431
MICWLAILICDRFSDRDWARSVVSRAPSRTKAVGKTRLLKRDGMDADRVTKDC